MRISSLYQAMMMVLVLAENDDSQSSLNSQIIHNFKPGTYIIEATTYRPRQTGEFNVSVTALAPSGAVRTPDVTSGNATLAVSWASLQELVSSYKIQHKQTIHADWPTTHSNVTSTTTTISGLTNGTSYDVRVRACNGTGCGPWSLSEAGTPATNPSALPAKPAGLRANGDLDDDGNVAVRWNPASRDISYRLRYAEEVCTDSGDDSATCTPDLPPWATSNATINAVNAAIKLPSSGGLYRLQAQAVNHTGASGWSDVAFVFPTDSALGGGTRVATAPFHGFRPKNTQGSHEFRIRSMRRIDNSQHLIGFF